MPGPALDCPFGRRAARSGGSRTARPAGARLIGELRTRGVRPLDHRAGAAGSAGSCWPVARRACPPYILPPPSRVAVVLMERYGHCCSNRPPGRATEMMLGLALGLLLGAALAVLFAASAGWRRWALPLVIVSQAIPGDRRRPAARAVARLRHGVQGRDGRARDLLPGGQQRCTTVCAAPIQAGSNWRAPWMRRRQRGPAADQATGRPARLRLGRPHRRRGCPDRCRDRRMGRRQRRAWAS